MQSITYDRTTADDIFKGAKYFRVKKDGVWLNALPDDGTPEAVFFQWHPLRPIYQRGGLDPKCNPSLPIPFTARELAAVFLDGAGALLASEQFGDWGDGPDEFRLDKFFNDSPKVKEVVRDAFDAYREALTIVGTFPISARQKREDARLAYRAAKVKDRNELDQAAIDHLLQREDVNQAEQDYGEACKAFEIEEAQWQKDMLLFLLHKHDVNRTEGGDTGSLHSKALLPVVSPLGRAGALDLTLKAEPKRALVTNKVPMLLPPTWRITAPDIPPIPDCSWPDEELDIDPMAPIQRQQSTEATANRKYLETGDMAGAFDFVDGLKRKMSDVNNHQWLLGARVTNGKAPTPSTWCPLKLAKILTSRGVDANAINKAFLSSGTLKEWRVQWQEENRDRNAFGK